MYHRRKTVLLLSVCQATLFLLDSDIGAPGPVKLVPAVLSHIEGRRKIRCVVYPLCCSSLSQTQSCPIHKQGADNLFSAFCVLLLAVPEAALSLFWEAKLPSEDG